MLGALKNCWNYFLSVLQQIQATNENKLTGSLDNVYSVKERMYVLSKNKWRISETEEREDCEEGIFNLMKQTQKLKS